MDDPVAGVTAALCSIVAVLFVILLVVSVRRRRRKRERMQLWAEQHGWHYTQHPGVDWGRRLPGGNRDGVRDCLSTTFDGRPVSIAEYSVTDGDANTHHHLVAVTRLARPLPPIRVEPRGPLSRRSGIGDAAFDRAFRVHGDAPAGIFTPALIAAQVNGALAPNWEVAGAELFVHWPGRLAVADVPQHASRVLWLARLLDGR